MKWPNANLGPASEWGRMVVRKIEDLDRDADRQRANEKNANKGQNSSSSAIGRQIQALSDQAAELIAQQEYHASLYSKSMTDIDVITAPTAIGEGYIPGTNPLHKVSGIATTGFVNITVSAVIRAVKGTGAMTFVVLEEDGTEWFSPNISQALRTSGNALGASFSFPFHVPKKRRMTYVPVYYYFNGQDNSADPVRFSNMSISMQVLSTLDE